MDLVGNEVGIDRTTNLGWCNEEFTFELRVNQCIHIESCQHSKSLDIRRGAVTSSVVEMSRNGLCERRQVRYLGAVAVPQYRHNSRERKVWAPKELKFESLRTSTETLCFDMYWTVLSLKERSRASISHQTRECYSRLFPLSHSLEN